MQQITDERELAGLVCRDHGLVGQLPWREPPEP